MRSMRRRLGRRGGRVTCPSRNDYGARGLARVARGVGRRHSRQPPSGGASSRAQGPGPKRASSMYLIMYTAHTVHVAL